MAKVTPNTTISAEEPCAQPVGRPTSYKKEYADQAYKLCLLLGATDEILAQYFDVCVATIYNWKNDHQEFLEAVSQGKLPADSYIASKLYSRAAGAEWIEEVAIKKKTGQHTEVIEVIELRKAAPPDTVACLAWLKNRQPKHWRDKVDMTAEITGKDGTPLIDLPTAVVDLAQAYAKALKGT